MKNQLVPLGSLNTPIKDEIEMVTPDTKNAAPVFRQKKRSKPEKQTPSPNRPVPNEAKALEREQALMKKVERWRNRCDILEGSLRERVAESDKQKALGKYHYYSLIDPNRRRSTLDRPQLL